MRGVYFWKVLTSFYGLHWPTFMGSPSFMGFKSPFFILLWVTFGQNPNHLLKWVPKSPFMGYHFVSLLWVPMTKIMLFGIIMYHLTLGTNTQYLKHTCNIFVAWNHNFFYVFIDHVVLNCVEHTHLCRNLLIIWSILLNFFGLWSRTGHFLYVAMRLNCRCICDLVEILFFNWSRWKRRKPLSMFCMGIK